MRRSTISIAAAVTLLVSGGAAFGQNSFWDSYNRKQGTPAQQQAPRVNQPQQFQNNTFFRDEVVDGQRYQSTITRYGNQYLEEGTYGGKPFTRNCTVYGNNVTCN